MTTAEVFAQFGSKTTADEVVDGMDLSGKFIVITSANTGIGYETARSLASAGARLLLACRNTGKASDATERIRERHPNADVSFAELDLGSFDSIHTFVETLNESSIDVLICNAGVINASYHESDGDIEHTVGVSHLGHFLLVRGLLPKLLAAGGGRVVMVGSEAHRTPRTLEFEKFPLDADNYSQLVSYRQAKLCNTLFANELQHRYGDQDSRIAACTPATSSPPRSVATRYWLDG